MAFNIIYAPTPIPSRPGVYVNVLTPNKVRTLSTGAIVGAVFEANRGPLDTAVLLTSEDDYALVYGSISADATGTPLSGGPAVKEVLETAGAAISALYGVRVASSLVATGYLLVKDASSNTLVALHAKTPGTWAQDLQVTITNDTVGNTWGLTVQNLANPAEPADMLTTLPYTDNAALLTALAGLQLMTATQPVLAGPTAAPTVTASTGAGTVPAGTYRGIATYTNAQGETQGSPETATITLSANGTLTVSVPTLAGATGFDYYSTAANGPAGSETFAGSGTPGTPLAISAPWVASTKTPPTFNTATTGAGSTTALPAPGTYTIPATAGSTGRPGADGAQSGAARHVGSSTDGTGIYALLGYNDVPDIVFLAGVAGTDTSQWSAQAALAETNGYEAVVGFPVGTTQAVARAAVLALSSLVGSTQGDHIKAAWPDATVYESALGGQIRVPAQAYLAAATAAQPPQMPAANKPLAGASFVAPSIRAVGSDIDSLNDFNADVHANVLIANLPGGGTGFFTDRMLSGAKSFEVRVKKHLAREAYRNGGQFYQVPITTAEMTAAQEVYAAMLQQFANDGEIVDNDPGTSGTTTPAATPVITTPKSAATATSTSTSASSTTAQYWAVVCDTSINTPATIQAGEFHVRLTAQVPNASDKFIIDLNAGVGVTVS